MKDIKTDMRRILYRQIKYLVLGFIIVTTLMFYLSTYINSKLYNANENTPVDANRTEIMETSLFELQETFVKMNNEAGWDVNKPLIWGYYFYDHSPEKLRMLSKKLKGESFNVYEIRESGSETDDAYLLYAYEKAVHTPNSLLERNKKLAQFAIENSIEVFDGWEAGKEPLK